MKRSSKRKVAAGAAAALAVAGAGGALAATHSGSPGADSQAIVADAATQLGVQPSALSAALKKALANRVDAQVAAGRLTQAQGDALKARIQAGDFPIFGGARHGGFGGRGHFGVRPDAAAAYLGVTPADLRTALQGGKSLAQVAQDKGKSVDGLVAALTDQAKKDLDSAVASGRLTAAQEQTMLADLPQRIADLVNRTGRPGFRAGPPPAAPTQ
jgi:hypothetical protein